MRIALIGPAHPYKGGGARHTTELAHRLAAAGHDVVIESWHAMYPAALYPGVQHVDVAEGPPYPRTRRLLSWRRPGSWLRAGRRLRGACDLAVFVYLTPVQAPVYLSIMWGLRHGSAAVKYPWRRRAAAARATGAAGQYGPRVVLLCHNVLPHERRRGDIALTRAVLRRSDAALTHTERLARAARGLAPGTPVRVAAMPPHLPVSRAAAAAAGAPVGRGATRRLLFFGIVRPYKGLDVLLRAMARAPATLVLTVAGEFWGGTGDTLALVGDLGLASRVELRPGYVPADEIAALFGGADALVLPYRSATSSQNAWLAFAHGLPVIATRTGTFAEQVTDGVDGLLCEPDNAADLARALARLCEPGVAEQLRAGVSPVDGRSLWDAYLGELVLAEAEPVSRRARAGQTRRAREVLAPHPDRRGHDDQGEQRDP